MNRRPHFWLRKLTRSSAYNIQSERPRQLSVRALWQIRSTDAISGFLSQAVSDDLSYGRWFSVCAQFPVCVSLAGSRRRCHQEGWRDRQQGEGAMESAALPNETSPTGRRPLQAGDGSRRTLLAFTSA